ncbi:laminin G domain protein [Cooperia oncophora]
MILFDLFEPESARCVDLSVPCFRFLDVYNGIFLGGRPALSGKIEQGFTGCIANLTLNDELIEFSSLAEMDVRGMVNEGCAPRKDFCDKGVCSTSAKCANRWNGANCRCPHSGAHHMRSCHAVKAVITHRRPLTLHDEESFVIYRPQEISVPFSLSFEFRTSKADMQIIVAEFEQRTTFFRLEIEDGLPKVWLGQTSSTIDAPELHAGVWTKVEMEFREEEVKTTIDGIYSVIRQGCVVANRCNVDGVCPKESTCQREWNRHSCKCHREVPVPLRRSMRELRMWVRCHIAAMLQWTAKCKCAGQASGRRCDRCTLENHVLDPKSLRCRLINGQCPSQIELGVQWPTTSKGSIARQSCPGTQTGLATRTCDNMGRWLEVNNFNCTRPEYVIVDGKMVCKHCEYAPTDVDERCRLRSLGFEGRGLVNINKALSRLEWQLSFRMATIAHDGVLLFSGDRNSDFIEISIQDRVLKAEFSLGDQPKVVRMESERRNRVNDGEWHTVHVIYYDRHLTLLLDDCDAFVSLHAHGAAPCAAHARIDLPPKCVDLSVPCFRFLDVYNGIFLGGRPALSGKIEQGFTGCIANLTLNDELIEFSSLAEMDVRGMVNEGCAPRKDFCAKGVCSTSAKCANRWNGANCRCPHSAHHNGSCHAGE